MIYVLTCQKLQQSTKTRFFKDNILYYIAGYTIVTQMVYIVSPSLKIEAVYLFPLGRFLKFLKKVKKLSSFFAEIII